MQEPVALTFMARGPFGDPARDANAPTIRFSGPEIGIPCPRIHLCDLLHLWIPAFRGRPATIPVPFPHHGRIMIRPCASTVRGIAIPCPRFIICEIRVICGYTAPPAFRGR
jgi:hypothetical protein